MRRLASLFSLRSGTSCWAWASWQRAMGGGPRTFPGGITKWQWKRMMVKKCQDREERRLERDKEVYRMRQRAEVLAAHPELQQPWEKLTTFPAPGTSAQQQLTGLVSRFYKASDAEDLWTQRDGPQQNDHEHVTGAAAMGGTNDLNPLLDAHRDAGSADAKNHKDQVPTMQTQSRGRGRYAAKVATPKKKKEVSSIGKSMQDYLDSFETDPLGLAVDSGGSSKEKQRDPLVLALTSKANTKKGRVGKNRVN